MNESLCACRYVCAWALLFISIVTNLTNKRSLEYWSAMEALSDYLAGNTSQRQEELVLRTARAYAESKRKVSEIGRIASEGARVQDILW